VSGSSRDKAIGDAGSFPSELPRTDESDASGRLANAMNLSMVARCKDEGRETEVEEEEKDERNACRLRATSPRPGCV
jgi:acyl-CoA hydrolase